MSTSAPPQPADTAAPSSDPRPAIREAWKNIAGYVAAAAGAVVVLTLTMQLWRARLNVPLYDSGDNLMSRMFVQNILESGWVLDNARLGAARRPGHARLPHPRRAARRAHQAAGAGVARIRPSS